MDVESIGSRLKGAREKAGMSQQGACEALGVSRTAVANWEAGRHLPNLLQFRELLVLYVASPYAILFGKSKMQLTDDERDELMALAARASITLRLKISMAMTLLSIED